MCSKFNYQSTLSSGTLSWTAKFRDASVPKAPCSGVALRRLSAHAVHLRHPRPFTSATGVRSTPTPRTPRVNGPVNLVRLCSLSFKEVQFRTLNTQRFSSELGSACSCAFWLLFCCSHNDRLNEVGDAAKGMGLLSPDAFLVLVCCR